MDYHTYNAAIMVPHAKTGFIGEKMTMPLMNPHALFILQYEHKPKHFIITVKVTGVE